MATKRTLSDTTMDIVPSKRAKSMAVVASKGPPGTVMRTSSLQAPIMLLTGHGGEVFGSKFSPDGSTVASASFDQQIFLWNTDGDCENYAALTGHSGAVLDVHWTSDGSQLLSASTDKTCAVWDVETGTRIRRLRGHASIVNSCSPARGDEPLVVTGSDDGTIKMWDTRRRNFLHSFANKYQVTSVCFGNNTETVITGGLDNVIKVWDTRKMSVAFELCGHKDTVTGLKLSPDGNHVLSNSMDNTVKMWDVRPFSKQRLSHTFSGAKHGFEKNLIKCAWTPDGKHVGCGSADRNVYIWNVLTEQIKYRLPGHTGSVNDIDFHPSEPIVVSGSSDRKLYLGELTL